MWSFELWHTKTSVNTSRLPPKVAFGMIEDELKSYHRSSHSQKLPLLGLRDLLPLNSHLRQCATVSLEALPGESKGCDIWLPGLRCDLSSPFFSLPFPPQRAAMKTSIEGENDINHYKWKSVNGQEKLIWIPRDTIVCEVKS